VTEARIYPGTSGPPGLGHGAGRFPMVDGARHRAGTRAQLRASEHLRSESEIGRPGPPNWAMGTGLCAVEGQGAPGPHADALNCRQYYRDGPIRRREFPREFKDYKPGASDSFAGFRLARLMPPSTVSRKWTPQGFRSNRAENFRVLKMDTGGRKPGRGPDTKGYPQAHHIPQKVEEPVQHRARNRWIEQRPLPPGVRAAAMFFFDE